MLGPGHIWHYGVEDMKGREKIAKEVTLAGKCALPMLQDLRAIYELLMTSGGLLCYLSEVCLVRPL